METIGNTTTFEEQNRVLFFAAMTICLLGQLLSLSYWPGRGMGNYITYVGLLVLMPRFVSVLSAMRPVQSVFVLLTFPLILLTCYNVIEKVNVFLPYVFVISAKNIKFRLIIKYFFVINLVFLVSSLIFSRLGIVKDYINERAMFDMVEGIRGDTVVRHSFGYGWVTSFPAHVTYLWAMWLYLRKGFLKFYEYILLFFSIWFVNHFCDARMESATLFLLGIMSLYYRYRVEGTQGLSFLENFYLKFSVPIFAFVSIYLTYQYEVVGGEVYEVMDFVASGRLSLGADAMFTAGIPLFGQAYKQIGGDIAGNAYNYIDCSYLAWLIIYGVFFFILATSSLTYICHKSIREREFLLAIIMSLLAIEGSIVSVFLNFAYNPFIMATFAEWDESVQPEADMANSL